MRILPVRTAVPAPLPPARSRSSTFASVLGDRIRDAPPSVAALPAGPSESPVPGPALPARALLERALGAESRIDALLTAAATGRTFSPGQLLALQSTVFRYSQTVEVVSRVADRLVGTIKQTMGTQL
jgi:hypothetical protein